MSRMLVLVGMVVCTVLVGCHTVSSGADYAIPEQTAQRAVADYIEAALAGDRATQVRLSVPGKKPAYTSGEGLSGVVPEQAWVKPDRALVASVPTMVHQPRGPETGYIVFSLRHDDEAGWRLEDIDFEDEAGLKDEVARFLDAD